MLLAFLGACRTTPTPPGPENSGPATAGPVQTPTPPDPREKKPPAPDAITVEAQPVEIARGNAGEASIVLKIPAGYHLNANPASQGQVATTLEADPVDRITPGKTVYPPGASKKVVYAPGTVQAYEGTVTLVLPLATTAQTPSGTHTINGKLLVQPCDEKFCYDPRNLRVPIRVTVR